MALAALIVSLFGSRALQYISDDRVPISGMSGMISALALSNEIASLVSAFRVHTREGDGLVVLPEGALLNHPSGCRNPLRYKLYLPGYVNAHNETAVIGEPARARPAAIVIWNRPTGEYGPATFGFGYAKKVRTWIDENYVAHRYQRQAILAIPR